MSYVIDACDERHISYVLIYPMSYVTSHTQCLEGGENTHTLCVLLYIYNINLLCLIVSWDRMTQCLILSVSHTVASHCVRKDIVKRALISHNVFSREHSVPQWDSSLDNVASHCGLLLTVWKQYIGRLESQVSFHKRAIDDRALYLFCLIVSWDRMSQCLILSVSHNETRHCVRHWNWDIVTVRCSVLQCGAVRCSMLQYVVPLLREAGSLFGG